MTNSRKMSATYFISKFSRKKSGTIRTDGRVENTPCQPSVLGGGVTVRYVEFLHAYRVFLARHMVGSINVPYIKNISSQYCMTV